MNYEIAIPSYQRPETLVRKTLTYLRSTNVDLKRVTVFLANKKELASYKLSVKNIKLVIGQPTLRAQRRFIANYYKPGTFVFNIDDDISGIFYAPNPKKLEIVKDLNSLITTGFGICLRNKTKLWGLAASCNPFFIYGKGVSTDLKFIIGAAFGVISERDKSLWPTVLVKDDYERSIKYFLKYGSVIRFGGYSMKNNIYKEPGGLQTFRTKEISQQDTNYLFKTYPTLVKLNPNRKTGHAEILLTNGKKK